MTGEQFPQQDKAPQLAPYRFKKGVSGNPAGRPPGKSMKTWVKEYLMRLPDDERVEFVNALPPTLVWQMAEGNPDTKSDIKLENESTFTAEQINAAREILGLEPIGTADDSK